MSNSSTCWWNESDDLKLKEFIKGFDSNFDSFFGKLAGGIYKKIAVLKFLKIHYYFEINELVSNKIFKTDTYNNLAIFKNSFLICNF